MPNHIATDDPIASAEEDLLNRKSFVSRLVSSLVEQDGVSSVATGVTVGLTGPWGTGKSSLLNMVENEIRDSFPNSVCVRFNPWLVGDHKELIGQFFSEWIMALDSSRLTRQAAYELVDYLKIYGKIVGGVT